MITMIKLTFCLRRKPELSLAEFQEYWRETHAPLVAERAEILGIRRYVQVHTTDAAGLHAALRNRNGGSPPPYDGIAELWFDSLDSFASSDPDAQLAAGELLADERNFIDLPNSPLFVAQEHTVIG